MAAYRTHPPTCLPAPLRPQERFKCAVLRNPVCDISLMIHGGCLGAGCRLGVWGHMPQCALLGTLFISCHNAPVLPQCAFFGTVFLFCHNAPFSAQCSFFATMRPACITNHQILLLRLSSAVSDIPDWCYVEAWGTKEGTLRAGARPTAEDVQRFWQVSPIAHVDKAS